MTERIPLDELNSDQYDALHAELDRLTAELADYDERAEQQDQRAARAEAQLTAIRHLHRPVGVVAAAEFGEAPDCAACHRAWPCQTYNAVTEEPAIVQTGRWLHVDLTSPDATTANTSALALADHVRAEFPGVGMRISSNAVEGAPTLLDPCPRCESSPVRIPRARMAEHVATVHPEVRDGGPRDWLLEGGRDLDIPEHHRFTAHPVTPEMERAATERARQAAADSERSAAWIATRGEAIGGTATGPEESQGTTANNPPGSREHVYLSTGCWHGDHDYCKSMTGLGGAKRPASCKKCGARCICPCHQQTEPPVHIGGQANAEDCPACTGTNPDYPFICPGPTAEQSARTTPDNPAGA